VSYDKKANKGHTPNTII